MFSSTGKTRSRRAIAILLLGGVALGGIAFAPAGATDLREAIAVAVQSNPQINQAVANREAIDFEREQAQGLYRPRVSVEASAGARRTDTPTRRVLGSDKDVLAPVEGNLLVEQTLFDSGARRAELSRQAARSDGAANRVEERSQYIALEVARRYIDYLLQQRIVAAADDNITFHRKLTDDLREGVRSGSISIADQQQAEERLQASLARRTEAQEELTNAAISFRTLTGLSIDSATVPPALTAKLPATLEDAIAAARANNPLVREAMADIDAAYAVRDAAKAQLGPRVALEGRARYGQDVDGFRGHASDLYGRVVARWDLYTGGINQANVQENTRRASETRFRLHEVARQAEDDARTAWNRYKSQAGLVDDLDRQRAVADDLIVSYREQFNVGRRSLLDLLDSQNTRYNVVVQAETARLAALFAQYRVLASTNELLAAVDVAPQKAAVADSRARFNVKQTQPAEVMERRLPY